MKIENSTLEDITAIFELYRQATAYMTSKNKVAWPEFSQALVRNEIEEKRQWKLLIDNEIVCVWATTLNDELIWGTQNNAPALYIHRIATNAKYRGQNFVRVIVDWANTYAKTHHLNYLRMDTVGLNEGLISHYGKFGFEFLGAKPLENTEGLPGHYKEGVVCLFQKEVDKKV